MCKRLFLIMKLSLLGCLIFPGVILADDLNTISLPLTLSAEQTTKLQQVFPASVTQTDTANAGLSSTSTEHLVWNKVPLTVILPVGEERLINFPDSVEFGYDTTLLNGTNLSVQNVNGTVYLTAKQAFAPQRVFARLKQTGELILLDISAKTGSDITPISIIVPPLTQAQLAPSTVTTTTSSISQVSTENPALSDIELTRFAVQQLYAPKRLLTSPPSVFRVPMHTTHSVALILEDPVTAVPLASWRSGDLYVTAILLRNKLAKTITLDPRNIRGQWKTSAFFPQIYLAPTGNPKDTTTVFLTSYQPFIESLGAIS